MCEQGLGLYLFPEPAGEVESSRPEWSLPLLWIFVPLSLAGMMPNWCNCVPPHSLKLIILTLMGQALSES